MIKRIAQKVSAFRQKRDLTTGSISKSIWFLAIPLVVGDFLYTLFNIVDMFWVGKLGPSALAAVAIAGTLMMVVITFVMGIATGTAAMVSRFYGAKNEEDAAEVAAQSILLGLFAWVILAILGFFNAETILRLMGAKAEVLTLGISYLQVIFVGSITLFFFFIFVSILRGAGDALTPTLVLVLSTVINIILDPFMIFGWGPFPEMGVTGAAVATVIAQLVGVVIGMEILVKGRSHLHLHTRYFKPNWDYIVRIMKIGIPSSIQMGLRSTMGVILMSIVAAFGTFAIAAYGVVFRLIMVLMMPGFSMSNSAATLVGQNLGAGNPDRAAKSAWLTAFYYAIFMLTVGSLGFIFAPLLVSIFNSTPEVVQIGTTFIRIVVFPHVFVAFGIVLGRSMAGAGDTISPLIITFITLVIIQLPLAIILPKFIGLKGVWYAYLVANIAVGILAMTWFSVGKWKLKKV